MARTINFVRDRQRNLSRLEIQDRQFFRWSLAAVSISIVLVLVVVFVRLFLLYQLRQVTAQQQQLKAAIVSKEEIEKSFTIFSFKLKTLTDLFGKRKEKQETLEYFSNLFNEDVVISQLDYSADTEELTFSLDTTNIFVMERVFEVMNGAEIAERYPTLQKSNLGRKDSGGYTMKVSILLSGQRIEDIIPESTQNVDGLPVDDLEPAAVEAVPEE